MGCQSNDSDMENVKPTFEAMAGECVDIAENMLAIARQKLVNFSAIRYRVGNFENYDFDSTYDAALSSLALHHLTTDEDKQQFYQKIYDNLNPGGVFHNADVILASSERLQQMYMTRWQSFMQKQVC